MISVEEAIQRILSQIPRLGKERLPILCALGRVLGEEIAARRDIPPWDNSAMDGYAVRWEDIKTASRFWPTCRRAGSFAVKWAQGRRSAL
jgi:molybdopterin biosynthesis enzyme